jgi:His/Glu/Gln/Arg/opine family amino acid ABC transporter permease subunit
MSVLASAAYHWNWGAVFNRDVGKLGLIGLKYTLIVSGLSFLIGSALGLLVAGLRLSHIPPFSQIAYIYTDFFRTTPVLVQLIWIFYVLPVLFGWTFSPVISGVIALSMNAGAFFAQAAVAFRPLELYTALAVAYFLLTYPLSLASSWLERRFRIQ